MVSPSIRPATPSDLGTLAALEVEAGQLFRSVGMPEVAEHDPGLEELRRSQGRGLVWVAEEDGEVAGYVVAAIVDGNAHIEQVSVAPAHARRGIGAALLGQVEVWGRAQGAPATTLTTFRDVAWNGPYYARLGYREMAAAQIRAGLAATIDREASLPGIDASRRCAMVKPNDPPG
jgi:predicted N-acetyltransferase YhbS